MPTQRATCVTSISCGVLNIPVKVYTGPRRAKVALKTLHATDDGLLQQGYTCGTCDKPVPRAEQGKGYEHMKGQYVVLDPTELQALDIAGKTIVVEYFCPASQIDSSREAGDVNLLGPDKGAASAYQLLREAMVKEKKVAIGRFTTRKRSHLVCLRPSADGGIVMVPLFYADEVRDFQNLETGAGDKIDREALGLVRQLIGIKSQDFDPSHVDLYKQAFEALVAAKLAGKSPRIVTVTEHPEVSMPVIDLISALKASLSETPPAKPAKRASRKAPTAKPRRKTANGRNARA